MTAILDRIERVVVWIGLAGGWVLLLPIIVSRFYDIIARQFTDAQSTLVQFIEWDGFFLLIFLIFGFGYCRDAHARIDILRTRFPPRLMAWIELFGILLLVMPFCVICIRYGIEHAAISHEAGDRWWVPFAEGWMRKAIVPFGFLLLLVAAAIAALRNLAFLLTGRGGPAPARPDDAPGAGPVS